MAKGSGKGMVKRKTKGRDKPTGKEQRPPWQPTDEQRMMVKLCKADGGFTHEQIAAVLKIDADTLFKHCKEELQTGKLEVDAKIGGKLVQKCLAGDLGSIVWYEKTRRGFKDLTGLELTGANGGPIDSRSINITAEMSATEAADAYLKLVGGK